MRLELRAKFLNPQQMMENMLRILENADGPQADNLRLYQWMLIQSQISPLNPLCTKGARWYADQDPEIWNQAHVAIQHEYDQVLKMRLESNNFASHCQVVHQLFNLQVEAPMGAVLEDLGASTSTHTTPDANWRPKSRALSPPSNGMEQWLTDGDQDPLPCLEQDTLAPFDQNPFEPPFEMVEGDEEFLAILKSLDCAKDDGFSMQ